MDPAGSLSATRRPHLFRLGDDGRVKERYRRHGIPFSVRLSKVLGVKVAGNCCHDNVLLSTLEVVLEPPSLEPRVVLFSKCLNDVKLHVLG